MNKFNNETLNREYKKLCDDLKLIDYNSTLGNVEYEIQKAKIHSFVMKHENYLN